MSIFFPDISECELDIDNCDKQATCSNTEGSYSCACNAGWTGDGFTCEGIKKQFYLSFQLLNNTNLLKICPFFPDINECELDIDNCDQHATCTNTEGSYSCACNAGWRGNGSKCEGKREKK